MDWGPTGSPSGKYRSSQPLEAAMTTRFQQFVIVILSLLIATLALAQDQPRGTKLTGADLTKLVEPAVLLEGRNLQHNIWVSIALMRGGTMYRHGFDRGGSGGQDKGKWRITVDSLCFTFPTSMLESTEQCRNYYKLDDGSYEGWTIPDNQLDVTFRARRPQ